MSAVWDVIMAIYGGSLMLSAGGALLMWRSARFRRLVWGDQQTG